MPLLTELENLFVLVLQRCRAYGAASGETPLNHFQAGGMATVHRQRRRRDISIERQNARTPERRRRDISIERQNARTPERRRRDIGVEPRNQKSSSPG